MFAPKRELSTNNILFVVLFSHRYCKETECARFEEQVSSATYCKELEMVKFICKDFWTLLFKKPVSGLRTNTGPNPKV